MKRLLQTISMLVMLLSPAFVQAQYNYEFAYLVTFGTREGSIGYIDPTTSASRLEQYVSSSGYGNPLRYVYPSPDGEWIVITTLALDQSNLLVQAFNTTTQEKRDIIHGFFSLKGTGIVWSPNSEHIAINFSEDGINFNIYVYSLGTDTLNNITRDNLRHVDIGWSFDSSQLTTFTETCSGCQSRLELYNLSTASLVSSVDLSSLTLAGSNACNPAISSNGRQVGFISNCGLDPVAQVDFPSDIYIWDVAANRLNQVTTLDLEVDGRYLAEFRLGWADSQNLLVGINFQISTMQEFRRLLAYDVSISQSAILRNDVGRDFSLNPVNGELAIRQELNVGTIGEINEVLVIPIQISAGNNVLSLDTMSLSTDVPEGCGLNWSPDGTLLAYPVYTDGCQGTITSIVFVNPATGLVQEHPLSIDGLTADDYVVPIGWVAR